MQKKSYAPIPMVPGPVSLLPQIIEVMGRDYGSGQLEEDFLPLYKEASLNLASLAGTKNSVIIMTGEGMLALWACLKSCLAPKDKVLAIGTGVFGDGIGQMAASFGCELKALSLPYNSTLDLFLPQIEEAIDTFKPKMITVVHCETPSGTLNPLQELGKLKAHYNVPLLYVDAVSSWGGVEINADEWDIDLLLGGSQKCLSAPPSMSFMAVSEAAWQAIEKVNYKGYDAILPFKTIYTDGRCPYTPYWHGVAALKAATESILKEDKDACFKRHKNAAATCVAGLKNIGIELFPQANATSSPTVTAAMIPAGYNFNSWQKKLREHGLVTAGSFGPMYDKVFRLGHMGTQANKELVEKALAAIAAVITA